jgi:hypothetical protein
MRNRMLLSGSILKHGHHFDYWNQPLNMHMHVWYLDCQEAGLCCYLVTHTENLLRPLQTFYFHLWHYLLTLPCISLWYIVITSEAINTLQFDQQIQNKITNSKKKHKTKKQILNSTRFKHAWLMLSDHKTCILTGTWANSYGKAAQRAKQNIRMWKNSHTVSMLNRTESAQCFAFKSCWEMTQIFIFMNLLHSACSWCPLKKSG